MRCMSCEAEINPKWKHAIENNICPSCGSSIMLEELKNLLSSLRGTMEIFSESFPEQLDDWMLSNFNYIKTNSPQLASYVPKQNIIKPKKVIREINEEDGDDIDGDGGSVVLGQQDQEITNEFLKRAEVSKAVNKTAHLQGIVKEIKRKGAPMATGSGAAGVLISADMLENADPEAVAEMQSMLSGDNVTSALMPEPDGEDDVHDNVAAAMVNKFKGNGSNASSKDLETLRKLQTGASAARRNSASGKGSFSRS